MLKRALKQVDRICDQVETISYGKDLTKRLPLPKARDELYELSQKFNQMFERLEQSFEKEQQFTADVSHELRTPVTVIISQCEYLIEDSTLEKEEQEGLKDDFFYIKEKSQDIMLDQIISLCKGRLKNFGDYDFLENIQILSPTKKGLLGTKELNKRLQEELNPSNDEKKEKKVGEVIFREGDRVMQVKNNYDIYWEKGNTRSLTYENGTGIFNGELGKILKIDFLNKQIKILFDDEKEAWYAFSDMDQIEHAYAITVHKAQGSEFDVVIMVVTQSSAMLLTRNLLYTGLTRAKKLLILIGNDNVVKFMIQNADTKIRNTGLEYKLKMIS